MTAAVPRFPDRLAVRRFIVFLLVAVFTATVLLKAVAIIGTAWADISALRGMKPLDGSSETVRRLFPDFAPVFRHAERVRLGQPLYWPWPEYGPHVMTAVMPTYPPDRLPYPPFLTPVLSLLSGHGFLLTASVWYALLAAAVGVYAACLAKLASGVVTLRGVLLGLAFIVWVPGSGVAFDYGNVDILLWALVGIALTVPALRGASFAIIALIKLYGAWPLLFAWRREGRRIFYSAAATVALAALASSIIVGPTYFLSVFSDWSRYMLPVVGQGTFKWMNVSVSMAGLRLVRLLGWEYTVGPLPSWAHLYLTVVGIAAPLITGWVTRAKSKVFQYSAIVSAALLFGPICWGTYLPMLLAPLAIIYRESDGAARISQFLAPGGSPSSLAPEVPRG